ncbi:hypothetical protein RI054_18g84770 [Pseudoscourfieldia marina]
MAPPPASPPPFIGQPAHRKLDFNLNSNTHGGGGGPALVSQYNALDRISLSRESSSVFSSMPVPLDGLNRVFTDDNHPLSARSYNRLSVRVPSPTRPNTTATASLRGFGPSLPRLGVEGSSRVNIWRGSADLGKYMKLRELRKKSKERQIDVEVRTHKRWVDEGKIRRDQREKAHRLAMMTIKDERPSTTGSNASTLPVPSLPSSRPSTRSTLRSRSPLKSASPSLYRLGSLPTVEEMPSKPSTPATSLFAAKKTAPEKIKMRGIRPNRRVPGNYVDVMQKATAAMKFFSEQEQLLKQLEVSSGRE